MSENESPVPQEDLTNTPNNPDIDQPKSEIKKVDESAATLNFVQKKIPRWLKSGAISASLAITAVISACGGGDEYHPVTTGPTSQTGVNIIHATETPMPSQTATVEATKTAEATETPIEQTPVPMVLTDPRIEGAQPRLSIKDQTDILNLVSAELPYLNVPFVLSPGTTIRYDEVKSVIIWGIDNSVTRDQAQKWAEHEKVGHVATNRTWLKNNLPAAEYQKTIDILDHALDNAPWQAPYPDLEKLFDPIASTVSDTIRQNYSPEQVAAVAQNHGRYSYIDGYGSDPFNEQSVPIFSKFTQFAQEDTANGLDDNISVPDLIRREENSPNSRLLAFSEDPRVAEAIKRIKSIQDKLEPRNLVWLSLYSNNINFNKGWKSLEKLTQLAMNEAYSNQDPLYDQNKQTDDLISLRMRVAKGEELADIGALTKKMTELGVTSPLQPLYDLLQKDLGSQN